MGHPPLIVAQSDAHAIWQANRPALQTGPPAQRAGVLDNDLASVDANRTASRQRLQDTIYRRPGCADHLRQLRLGEAKIDGNPFDAARRPAPPPRGAAAWQPVRPDRETPGQSRVRSGDGRGHPSRRSTSSSSGLRCIRAISGFRPITIPVVGLRATTDADLTPPSITDNSPATSDDPSVIRSISSPEAR
jgi:hypothetical protein